MSKQREFEPNYSSSLGLKQSNAETNMPFGALLDVLNMNLDGIGGKSPRNGYQEYFHLTDGLGGARVHDTIKTLIQFKPTTGGTSQTLAYANETIYLKNPSGTDTSKIRIGLTADARWDFVQYNDYIHGVNGTDTSFLYNGTDYVTISISGVGNHVNLALVAGGTLVDGDTYEYLVTKFDSVRARESAPFNPLTAPSIATSTGNQTIRITNFPASIPGEGDDTYRLYRRKTGETVFTLVVELPIATVTYDDTGLATGTTELVIDTGTIDVGYTAHPQSSQIEEAFDRIFMVPVDNPTIVVYSLDGGRSFAFPTGNFLVMGRNDGYPVLGMHKHGDAIVFHKRNSWWILDGDPATTKPRRLSGVGTQDTYASASDDNNVLRMTPNGFYLSQPTQFDSSDIREDYIGKDVTTEEGLIDWSNTNLSNIVSYNGNNSSHMYAMYPNTSTFTTKVLVFDTILKEWVKYQLGTDVTATAHYEQDGEKLLMLGDAYGMVWQWDSGDSDGTSLPHTLLNGTFSAVGASSFEDDTQIDDDGTATGGGVNTLEDTTQAWAINVYVGKQIYIVSGTGAGQYAIIASNTADEITITPTATWAVDADNTSVYQIGGWPVNGFIGVLVSTRTGTGGDQLRRISANTPTSATLTTAWSTLPDTTTTYSIGAIHYYGEEFWNNNGDSHLWKRMRWIVPYVRQRGDYSITISFRRDFRRGFDNTLQKALNLFDSESLWGVFLWGVDGFGAATAAIRRIRLRGKYRYYSIRYENKLAGQPFNWDGHGSVFQRLYDRNG